jgi:hypothetical protein
MQAVISAVPSGTPPIGDPAKATSSYVASLPSDVIVSSSDYSSVTLTWSSAANALGYAVYKNALPNAVDNQYQKKTAFCYTNTGPKSTECGNQCSQ